MELPVTKQPWEMTLGEFAKWHRPARGFQRYSSQDRADMQASHRLGFRQKQAVGENFYTSEFAPGRAFDTPKQAKQWAHRAIVETALQEGRPVPAEVLADYPTLAA